MADWINNNDESVNYILNNKKPKKSIIHLFLQRNTLLTNVFFHYTVILGINLGLIDGECVAVDGSIVKANANNNRTIRIEEVEFIQNLILDMVEIGVKTAFNTNYTNILMKIKNKKISRI